MGCMNLISDTWVKLTKCADSKSRTCHGSDRKHDQRWAKQTTGNSWLLWIDYFQNWKLVR